MDACVHLEEEHYKEGFDQGREQGRILGRDEGRLLGLDKGFEIGYEMGVYLGCISVLRDMQLPGIAKHVDGLYEQMTKGDVFVDPRNQELQEHVNGIRSKFKVIMALLDDDVKRRLVGTGILRHDVPSHDHSW